MIKNNPIVKYVCRDKYGRYLKKIIFDNRTSFGIWVMFTFAFVSFTFIELWMLFSLSTIDMNVIGGYGPYHVSDIITTVYFFGIKDLILWQGNIVTSLLSFAFDITGWFGIYIFFTLFSQTIQNAIKEKEEYL